jgi:hypothetical protein
VKSRTELEREAIRVLGESQRSLITKLSDRQVHEAVLYKLSPEFRCADRTDAAVSAAFDYVITKGQPSPTTSYSPSTSQATEGWTADLAARFAELEQKRLDAWKGPPPPMISIAGGAKATDIDAQLRELERKRQTASRR